MIKRNVKFYVLLTFPLKVLVFSILNLHILNLFFNTYTHMRVVLSTYAYVVVDFREIYKWKYMQINFSTMHFILQGSIKEKTRYLSQGFSALCRNTNYCTFYCLEKGVSGKVAFYKNPPVRLLFPLHHLILDISYDSFAVYNRASEQIHKRLEAIYLSLVILL